MGGRRALVSDPTSVGLSADERTHRLPAGGAVSRIRLVDEGRSGRLATPQLGPAPCPPTLGRPRASGSRAIHAVPGVMAGLPRTRPGRSRHGTTAGGLRRHLPTWPHWAAPSSHLAIRASSASMHPGARARPRRCRKGQWPGSGSRAVSDAITLLAVAPAAEELHALLAVRPALGVRDDVVE